MAMNENVNILENENMSASNTEGCISGMCI